MAIGCTCGSSTSSGPSVLASAPQAIVVTPDPNAKLLRVMTYNVNFGLEGDRRGIDAIVSANPDLVFLQETTPAWEKALVGRLGLAYPHHRFEHTRNEWVAGGLGVMSRWPAFCQGTLATIRMTRSSARLCLTLTAVTRWPTWGGSKVPPKTPMCWGFSAAGDTGGSLWLGPPVKTTPATGRVLTRLLQ